MIRAGVFDSSVWLLAAVGPRGRQLRVKVLRHESQSIATASNQILFGVSNAVAAAQIVKRSVSSLVITVGFFRVSHDQKQHACGVSVSACHNVRFHGLGACKCKFRCLTCSSVRHLSVLASFLLSFFFLSNSDSLTDRNILK